MSRKDRRFLQASSSKEGSLCMECPIIPFPAEDSRTRKARRMTGAPAEVGGAGASLAQGWRQTQQNTPHGRCFVHGVQRLAFLRGNRRCRDRFRSCLAGFRGAAGGGYFRIPAGSPARYLRRRSRSAPLTLPSPVTSAFRRLISTCSSAKCLRRRTRSRIST